MKEKLKKSYRYIEKRTASFPQIFFHGGALITVLLLLYTLFDLQQILASGCFADLEERTVPLCEYAFLSGIIPLSVAALMKRM